MAYINHEKKALFLHNVKCGGCYIRDNLLEFYDFKPFAYNIHNKYEDFFDDKTRINYEEDLDSHTIRKKGKYRYYYSHQEVDAKIFNEYFIFTFVRNPYERLYSAYCYLKKLVSSTGKIRNSKENIDYFQDFKTFINNIDNINNISYYHAFITQYEQFINDSNQININYIGKQETLDDDFINILNIIGFTNIKHINDILCENKNNKSSNNNNIINEYDQEILSFVNKHFEKDFITFGYEMFYNLKDLQYHISNKENINIDNILYDIDDYAITKLINDFKIITEIFEIKDDLLGKYEDIIHYLLEGIDKNENNETIKTELSFFNSNIIDIKNYNIKIRKTQKKIIDKYNQLIEKTIITKKYQCSNCKFNFYNKFTFNIHNLYCIIF